MAAKSSLNSTSRHYHCQSRQGGPRGAAAHRWLLVLVSGMLVHLSVAVRAADRWDVKTSGDPITYDEGLRVYIDENQNYLLPEFYYSEKPLCAMSRDVRVNTKGQRLNERYIPISEERYHDPWNYKNDEFGEETKWNPCGLESLKLDDMVGRASNGNLKPVQEIQFRLSPPTRFISSGYPNANYINDAVTTVLQKMEEQSRWFDSLRRVLKPEAKRCSMDTLTTNIAYALDFNEQFYKRDHEKVLAEQIIVASVRWRKAHKWSLKKAARRLYHKVRKGVKRRWSKKECNKTTEFWKEVLEPVTMDENQKWGFCVRHQELLDREATMYTERKYSFNSAGYPLPPTGAYASRPAGYPPHPTVTFNPAGYPLGQTGPYPSRPAGQPAYPPDPFSRTEEDD